jgi:hypothetical protein
MLSKWKKTLKNEISDAEEFEVEVRELLAELKNNLDVEQLSQAEAMIAEGVELLDIVRVGNGVHNKKYAITILDGTFGKFEDTIDLLEETRTTD